MSMQNFGERLKAQRKNKSLTQKQLAKKLNLATITVAGYEQGTKYPSVEVLIRICETLSCTSDFLLGISDDFSFKMGGLTEEQVEPILQIISNLERSNSLLTNNNKKPEL